MNSSVRFRSAISRIRISSARVFILLAVFGLLRSKFLLAETPAEKERALAQEIRAAGSSSIKEAVTKANAAVTTNGTVTGTYSGNEIEDDETFAVGANGATVSLSWEMYEIADRLEVVSAVSLPGIFLPAADYLDTGYVQYEGGQTLYIPPGNSSFQVIMNRGGGTSGTRWMYTITVTQGDTTDLSGVDGNPNQIKHDSFDPLKDLVFDPVDPSTGAHDIRKSLLTLGGARPLTFEIDYNSLLGFNGPLGTGWSHNHQIQLQGLSKGAVLLKWNNKRQNVFQPLDSQAKSFASSDQASLFYTLTRNTDNSFSLRYKDQSTWAFDSLGRMTSQTNPIGQKIIYGYDGTGSVPVSITEPISGHSFSLAYDNQNKITQIADNTGRSVSFTYSGDQTDRLVGITLAEGSVSQTYTYTYDGNGRVLTGQTPEGITVFVDSYDAEQRVESQKDALGNTSYFSYDETTQPGKIVTTVTNRLGKKSVYVSDSNYHLLSVTDPLGHAITYTYDQNGSRTSVTNANSYKTQFAYDAGGNLISTTDAGGNLSSVVYNASNQPTSFTDASGQQKTVTYDNLNRPITSKDLQGNQTSYSYDNNSLLVTETLPRGGKRQFVYTAGQPTQISDPDGNTSTIDYDSKGRPTTITDANGGVSLLAYDIYDHVTERTNQFGLTTTDTFDSRGLKLTNTDALGNTTKFSYDGNKNLFYRQDALGNYTTFGYDAEDRMYGRRDANGNTTYFYHDDAGRVYAVADAVGNKTFYSPDYVGNVINVTDPYGNITTTTYNSRNLPIVVEDPLGHMTAYFRDSLGRVTRKTDPLGRTITYSYDANSRLLNATDPLQNTTGEQFDADGNLSALADAKKNTTEISYDAAGRMTLLATPSGQKTVYSYDPRGLLTLLEKPSGQQSKIKYDAIGRKISLQDGTGKTSYTYDANNRLLKTARDRDPITRAYDALGRVTTITDNGGNQIAYAYDPVGNLTSLTYTNGRVVKYTYDADNCLSTVTDPSNHVTKYGYDADSRLITTSRTDSSVETRTYDAAGHLTQISDTANGKNIYSSTRTFDAASQVTSEITKPKAKAPPLEVTAMTFDADNQLASFDGTPTKFDADGNMVTGPLPGRSSASLGYDNRNQLDYAGGNGYYYDAENFRISVGDKTGVHTNVYDRSAPLSRLLESLNPDGTLTSYVYGLGLISEETDDVNGNRIVGSYKAYHFDARGSTVAMTDGSGNIVGRAKYGPFGELIKRNGAAASTPFLFNGRYGVMTDANGLYYMRARYYDPAIRRFINQDPTLGLLGDGGGLNRFAFANGNPVSLIDPFGLSSDEDNNVGNYDFGSDTNPFDFGAGEPSILHQIENHILERLLMDGPSGPMKLAIEGLGTATAVLSGKALITDLGGLLLGGEGTSIGTLLVPGGNLIGEAGNGYRIRVIQGSAEDAETLFQQLTEGGELNTTTAYPGRLVNVPEGGTVGIRYTATKSPDTIATIDVNNVPGLEDIIKEIKFNP